MPGHTPGYFQKAFPFVFLSGDGDPYQDRPRDIKHPKSTWEADYTDWICKQAEAEECSRLQFLLNSRSQRISSRKPVQVAIINVGINRDNLATTQELLQDSDI